MIKKIKINKTAQIILLLAFLSSALIFFYSNSTRNLALVGVSPELPNCGARVNTCSPGTPGDQQEVEISRNLSVRETTSPNNQRFVNQKIVCYYDFWSCNDYVNDEQKLCVKEKTKWHSFLTFGNCKCIENCEYPLEIRSDGVVEENIKSRIFGITWTKTF